MVRPGLSKMMGYERDSVNRFKEHLRASAGKDRIKQISRQKPVLKNRVAEEIESAIVERAIEQAPRPSTPLRAACGGGLRPALTAAPPGALQGSGRDGETPFSRTEKLFPGGYAAKGEALSAFRGRWCFGKTPMQTFLDAKPIAEEKMIAA